MNTPWFDPNLYGWVPGTVYGVLGGLFGSVVGVCASRGKGRKVLTAFGVGMLCLGVAFLVAGAVAYFSGQPGALAYALFLPGVLGVFLFPNLLRMLRLAYRQAEARKAEAQDLR